MRGLPRDDIRSYHKHTMAIEGVDEYLTVAEVAARLKVHPITVRRLIKAGRLPVVRVGRAVRVRAEDVPAHAASRPVVQLRPPPTKQQLEDRRRAIEETLARRDRRGNIGMSTLELVRASRRELEQRSERH